MTTVGWALLAGLAAAAAAGSGIASWFGWSWYRWRGYVRFKGLAHRVGPADLLHELVAYLRLGWWHVRALGRDRLRIPEDTAGPPVLCVHGFTQNGTNFWGLRQALHRRGRATRAVSLGRPARSIERYATKLRGALVELADRYDSFDVVAHSMGGLVLRHVLSLEPRLAERVRRIVTLGSPHAGTAVVRGLPAFLLPEIVLVQRRSEWLAGLPPLGDLAPEATRVTVAGGRDLVVYPAETCHEPGATQIELEGVGHAGLLASPEVIRLVVAALEGDELDAVLARIR